MAIQTIFMKVIPDFPNYAIDKTGQVWSRYKDNHGNIGDGWRKLKSIIDSSTGYPIVTLVHNGVRKNKAIHRLLAEAYIPNPHKKAHVNHKDCDKTNNSLDNLEWATPKENGSHAASNGRYQPQIDTNSIAIVQLCPSTGRRIATYSSLHKAGRQTGIAWQNIWKVCNNLRNTAGGFKWEYE